MKDIVYVMALDPGKLTGLVVLRVNRFLKEGHTLDQITVPSNGEYYLSELFDTMEYATSRWRIDHIVVERYRPDPRRKTPQYDHQEIIGACRLLAHQQGKIPVELQNASDMKKFAHAERLARYPLVGKTKGGHQLDALGHGLLFAETTVLA